MTTFPFPRKHGGLSFSNFTEFRMYGMEKTEPEKDFESTLTPKTRRKGGMHNTSIENIHKVIDPLFMDDFKAAFDSICGIRQRDVSSAAQHDKRIYNSDGTFTEAKNINGYLLDAPNIFLESRSKPLCARPTGRTTRQ